MERCKELQKRVDELEGDERGWWVDKERMQLLVDTLSSKNEELKKRLMVVSCGCGGGDGGGGDGGGSGGGGGGGGGSGGGSGSGF